MVRRLNVQTATVCLTQNMSTDNKTVKIVQSAAKNIKTRVPQGSILGSKLLCYFSFILLFLIYFNDIPNLIQGNK